MDVARTAKRLGADETVIVYRRTREKMPAHEFEVEEALEEGVIRSSGSSTIKEVDGGAITVEKMVLDEDGFPQPTGEFETIEADSWCWRWARKWTCRSSRRTRPWRSWTAW